jgi:acyl-CoA synthetase (AMP-forming)/AMP-acid ligase II
MHTALLLDMIADAAPDRLALGARAEGLTFAETRRRAHHGAAWLEQLGGTNVAFLGLNGPSLPIAVFASGMLARPFAPLNYRLPDGDLRKLLARTAPSVAIVDDDMVGRLGQAEGVTIVSRSAFDAACRVQGDCEAQFLDVDHDIAVLCSPAAPPASPRRRSCATAI